MALDKALGNKFFSCSRKDLINTKEQKNIVLNINL